MTLADTARRSLTARPYTHPDVQQLVRRLHEEQLSAYGFADDPTDTPPADYLPPHGLFIVVTIDGAPVACGGWRHHDPVTGEIKRMYAVPQLRGHGLGYLVIRHLEDDARAAGIQRMLLETGRDNDRALRLYTRCGYTAINSYMPGRDPQINRALCKSLAASSTGQLPA
jgi:GNAT superfamily N-acetyltransferase